MEEREGEREIGQSVLFWIECVWYFFNNIYIYIFYGLCHWIDPTALENLGIRVEVFFLKKTN